MTDSAEGATIYVTLEPCCHYGKTPPCTEAIIENKISRVVIGSRDPNPLVSGKGARILREHGIEVKADVLREECDAINPVFFHYIQNKMPYVVMKYAMTLDGKIACHTGKSQWVTGESARAYVHELRHQYQSEAIRGYHNVPDDVRQEWATAEQIYNYDQPYCYDPWGYTYNPLEIDARFSGETVVRNVTHDMFNA